MNRTRNQSTLDFPIRKSSRTKKVTKKLEVENTAPQTTRQRSKSRKSITTCNDACTETRLQNMTKTDSDSDVTVEDAAQQSKPKKDTPHSTKKFSKLSSHQGHQSVLSDNNVLSDSQLNRTPTKRKIGKENNKENGCSPPKISPIKLQQENRQNSKSEQNSVGPRIPLSPLKNVSTDPSLNTNEIMTRSRSPFKSPAKFSLSNTCSPQRTVKRLTFQSPSKSPLQRHDLSSPAKSPSRLGVNSPIRFLSKGVCSEMDSPRRSPRKLTFDASSPCRSAKKLPSSPVQNLNLSSPAKSPSRSGVNTPIRHLTKGISSDISSPKRSPGKLAFEASSPRRSPRKLPSSAMKFSSPTTLVSNLSLSSPSSNKKSVSVALFKPDVSAYRAVRQSLNTATPTTLVCREDQIEAMKDFLLKHVEKGKPGSLYISGAPGTGKTACLTSLLANMKGQRFREIFLNCMTVKTSASIYGKIVSELGLQPRTTEKENTKLIEKNLVNSKHPVVIILDEIDQLDSKNQEVLYSIFEWPSLKDSKLVLIGIANALDLTDRVLPRLQARPTFKPQLLHFPPYSKPEIVKILNQRIKEAGLEDVQIIRPTAIQFLAGKVAAVAGDVRKALDVCRRAVELCEIQARKQSVLRPSLGSPRKSPRKSPLKQSGLKMVEIPQIMAIFNEVYGSRVISAIQNAPESFTLQQKLLICCLLLFLKNARSKDITLGKFHELYTKVCRKRSIPDMDQSEFLTLCTLLESRGMLQVKSAKEVRSSKVVLRLNAEEAERVLGDRTLLAAVLEDKECLGKLCKT